MKLVRALAVLVAVVAVAALGLWGGARLRPQPPLPVRPPDPPSHRFVIGERFPNVRVQSADGAWTDTDALLRGRGAVVLLLDLECSPCATMVEQWKAHAASDSLRDVRLVGVTYYPLARIAEYRREHDVPFPVYADTAGAFVREHGVNDFPLVVVVDPSLAMRFVTFDPYAEFSADSIRAWVRR